jgi:hypothetical protein
VFDAILAALISAVCVGVPAFRAHRLGRIETPNSQALLAQIRAAACDSPRPEDWLWELDELRIDVERASHAPKELPIAFGRAALASGTAFSLLALAQRPELGSLPEALTAFLLGVIGAGGAAHFGRLARKRSQRVRAHWTEVARSVERSLEARANGS